MTGGLEIVKPTINYDLYRTTCSLGYRYIYTVPYDTVWGRLLLPLLLPVTVTSTCCDCDLYRIHMQALAAAVAAAVAARQPAPEPASPCYSTSPHTSQSHTVNRTSLVQKYSKDISREVVRLVLVK